MKIKTMKAVLLGKILLTGILLSMLALSSNAQTTPCRAGFDFKVDNNSKTVKFEAKSNFTPVVYSWKFGDGSAARGQETKHTYEKAGSYKVCLTAIAFNSTTNQRCTTQVCKEVKIADCDRLEAKFVFEVEGNTVKVRGKSNSKAAEAGYTFGDGTVVRGFEAKHTYKKPGTYKVCLIVLDSATGCKVEVCKRVIIEKEACKLEGDWKFETDGLTVKAKAKGNQDGLHYFWTYGDGTDGIGQTTKHTYKKPGTYQMCLVIFNPKTKCKVCICKRVVVEKPCGLKANFKYRTDSLIIKVKARSNASNNSKFIWNFGDGTIKTGKLARHKYAKIGVYKVTLTVIDKRRNCKITISKRVVIGKRSLTSSTSFMSSTPTINESYDDAVLQAPAPVWNVNITPSPAISNVSFSSSDASLAQVVISDMSGTEVLRSNGTLQNINVAELKHGMYYAAITAADGTMKTVKFIKN